MPKRQSKIEKLIAELCPEGVEFKALGEVADVCSGATPASGVAAYWENGTIPWMSSGEVNKETIYDTEKKIAQVGYDSCSTKMVPSNTVVVALAGQGKTRGKVARTRIPLCTNQSLCSIISNKALDSDFLYYFLKTQYQQLRSVSAGDGGRGGLNLQMIRDYRVPIPPLAIQQEIVKILDTFITLEAELETELEAELKARKKQYEYYRDELLTFGDDVEWSLLEEVVKMRRGVRVVKNQLEEIGKYPVYQNSMTPLGYYDKNNNQANTTFIITAGSAGEVGYSNIDFWAADDCFTLICPNNLQSKFLYYYLKVRQKYIFSKVRRASVPRLSRTVIEKIKIPIPPLAEQERIVAILDKFDALVNDISVGLPAEINTRRKQYEYYRNKLLTFKQFPSAGEAS
jgi:type I restriction enzyme, S subunit